MRLLKIVLYLLCWSTILWSLITGAECWQPKTFFTGKIMCRLVSFDSTEKVSNNANTGSSKIIRTFLRLYEARIKKFAVSPPLFFYFLLGIHGEWPGWEEERKRREVISQRVFPSLTCLLMILVLIGQRKMDHPWLTRESQEKKIFDIGRSTNSQYSYWQHFFVYFCPPPSDMTRQKRQYINVS